ncbi:MAG TPA: O-antigen ligase family protein [Candidatus Krumholzibacteria bacterium]|nr:O-antigen ligase family protein [Candidatus Krumholzibacteria bacterium]
MEIPRERRIIVVVTFVGACLFAFGFAVLAMRSLAMAAVAWLGILGFTTLFIEPFVGLLNYLAFLYIRPQDFVPAMEGMPIMLVLGGGTAALVILHSAIRKQRLVFARVPQHLFVLWFYVAIVVSQLALSHLRGALEASLTFVPTVVMYFLVVELVTTPRRVRIVFLLLVHLTLALAVQGLVMHFTGAGFGGKKAYEGRIQAVGIFSDPNDLALIINSVLPLMVLFFMQSRSLLLRIYAFVVSIIFVYAIFLTASRGGLLCLGLMAILLFQRKFGKIVGVAAGLAVMAALVVLGPRMNTISPEEASSYGRLEAWAIGMQLFKSSPLFGVGFGNFMEYHFRTAHNSFVLCASELGLLGLYPWLMVIWMSLRNTRFVEKELVAAGERNFAMYTQAAWLSLLLFVAGALLLSRTYHPSLFVLIGLCAAISRVYVERSDKRYALIERRDFLYGLAGMFAAVVVFYLFLRVVW